MIVKYLDDPLLRDRLPDILKMTVEFLQHDTALEYLDIFMKYLANTNNRITREDVLKAINNTFPHGGDDMIRGWAQEFVEEGLQKGLQQGLQKGLQKGLQQGRQEGMQKGELIGRVQLLQQILKQPVSIKTGLLEKSIDELQLLFDTLEKEWLKVQN